METEPARTKASAERIGFSVVLPAFDEEDAVCATLDALDAVLAGMERPHEIIVVDDGSRDATPRFLAERAHVRVLRHETNLGYGAALKTGIRAARYSTVVVMDADATYPARDIVRLLDACANADMVVGARIGKNVHPTPLRSFAKWFLLRFAHWITRVPIPDLNSGMRVLQRPMVDRFADVLPDGFSFTTTITIASLMEGLRVRFEPIDYMPRIGRSKLRPIRDTLRIMRQLLRLGLHFAPLRTAIPFALLAALASLGQWSMRGGHASVAALVCLAASLACLAAGATAEVLVGRRRDGSVAQKRV